MGLLSLPALLGRRAGRARIRSVVRVNASSGPGCDSVSGRPSRPLCIVSNGAPSWHVRPRSGGAAGAAVRSAGGPRRDRRAGGRTRARRRRSGRSARRSPSRPSARQPGPDAPARQVERDRDARRSATTNASQTMPWPGSCLAISSVYVADVPELDVTGRASSETRVSPGPGRSASKFSTIGVPSGVLAGHPVRQHQHDRRCRRRRLRSRSCRPMSRPGTGRIPYGEPVGRVGQRHGAVPQRLARPRRWTSRYGAGPNPFWWNV